MNPIQIVTPYLKSEYYRKPTLSHGLDNSSHEPIIVWRHNVTTRLVILSNRLQFWKNWQKRRTPRRNVKGTTDRHRRDGPSRRLQWKSILWTLRRPAGRTVTGTTARHNCFSRLYNNMILWLEFKLCLYLVREKMMDLLIILHHNILFQLIEKFWGRNWWED